METQNLRLVKYFVNNFYYGRTADLSHIASPKFKYVSNSGSPKNFEEYTRNRDVAFQNVEMFIEDFASEDDVSFKAFYNVIAKDQEIFKGDMTLKVVRGLLESVLITHDLSPTEFKGLNNTFINKDKLC